MNNDQGLKLYAKTEKTESVSKEINPIDFKKDKRSDHYLEINMISFNKNFKRLIGHYKALKK